MEVELEFEWTAAAGEEPEASDEAAPDDGPARAREAAGEAASATGTASSSPAGTDATASGGAAPGGGDAAPVAAEAVASLARFQLYRDRADEWRWRLVHRNGNIIATGGEGYSSRHNARKGLRSVMANAPGAEVDVEGGAGDAG